MGIQRMDAFEKRTRGYTAVPRVLAEDGRLSFKALGVLLYLLTRPDDWRPNYRQLMATHTDGEHSVRAALAELEEAGYLARRKVRYDDGTFGWVTTVSEDPGLMEPCPGNPVMVDPGSTNDGRTTTEEQEEVSNETSSAAAPKKPRKPDPIWDALEEHFGPVATLSERGKRGRTMKELKAVEATPEMIGYAVMRHKRMWPTVTCTERSLVNHWSKLTHNKVDAARERHHALMTKIREERDEGG